MTTGSSVSPVSPLSRRVVVVGASLAGLRTAEALRKAGYAGELTVVSEEIHRPYDRPPLSKAVLAGDTASEGTALLTSTELGAAVAATVARYAGVPSFWSDQYDAKLMSVGLPHLAEDTAVLDGSLGQGGFVVGYGRRGRMVGAVALDRPRELSAYRRHIAARRPGPRCPKVRTRSRWRAHSQPVVDHVPIQRQKESPPHARTDP